MRSAACLALLLAAACSGSSKSTPDLSMADDAAVATDLAFSGCPALSTFCSTSSCPASANDVDSQYCAPDGGVSNTPGLSVAAADCTGYHKVAVDQTGSSVDYYFDATSGALVAIVEIGYQGVPSCLGGPAMFQLPVCQPLATLCD